jgi:hypothetical protein
MKERGKDRAGRRIVIYPKPASLRILDVFAKGDEGL